MKKFISFALIAAMAVTTLVGCGNKGAKADGGSSDAAITVMSREDGSGTRGAFIELFVKNGSYKVVRPFNIVLGKKTSDAANDFVNYIMSADGQKIIEDNGYIPVDEGAAAYQASNAKGKVVVGGSSSVSPVMEKLVEAYSKANTNIQVDGKTIAKDGIAVIVNNESSVDELSTDQVKSIFTGETTSWSDITK